MFDLLIVTPKKVLMDEAVERVFLDGISTEFELLSFHAHLVGILRRGRIIINNRKAILVNKGVVKFFENKCVILVEEQTDQNAPV